MPPACELLLPLWASVAFSMVVYPVILSLEILGIAAAAGVSLFRVCRRASAVRRALTAAAVAVMATLVVGVLNLAANVLLWMHFGRVHEGQGAPFW